MEDNYLWDRSGEPDPDVQELEEILGTLRYKPRPLELPANVRVARRRSFFPAMAIAAAIALLAIFLGLWLSFNRRQAAPPIQARDSQVDQNKNARTPQVSPDQEASPAPVLVKNPVSTGIQKHREARNLLARNVNRAPRTQIRQPELTPEELAEKEQVLIALRLVSAKLNLAQRKALGTPSLSPVRNQHRIG